MAYTEYLPDIRLRKHIDAYWVVETGRLLQPYSDPIFPDGCIDIIINAGNNLVALNGITFKPGNAYLAGTMTVLNRVNRVSDSYLVGIRFKPGGFAAFYSLPLFELTDKLVEFPANTIVSLLDRDAQWVSRLDHFFTTRLTAKNNSIINITHTVYSCNGQITVDELAKKFHISNRTLERLCKTQIGISPKDLTGIIRFQHALKSIRNKSNDESLLHLAFDTGYYDHAHLTNVFKKYTGLTPSQIAAHYNKE